MGKAPTSHALTEVRTVHSRAKTALKTLLFLANPQDMRSDWEREYYAKSIKDPDLTRMIDALSHVADTLEEWAR